MYKSFRKVKPIIFIISIVILFILMVNLFYGCSKMSFLEPFENAKGTKGTKAPKGTKIKLEINKKENFSGMNKNLMNTGETYASYPNMNLNTSNWGSPTLVPGSNEYKKMNSYKNTPLPLNDGNMLMFSKTDFKPECCNYGSSYSNSMGCACLNVDSAKYLWQRGGNNIPLVQGSTI